MNSLALPKRRWGHAYALEDLLDSQDVPRRIAEQDFALLTLAGHLAAAFPAQLVFKGGFVLRHVHGAVRFSEDVDATSYSVTADRQQPERFNAGQVATVIRSASDNDVVRFNPESPTTDSPRSLDFDKVRVSGTLISETSVQVEISYREQVVDPPRVARIGPPFYEDFEILVMAASEMAAEKIRALAQRVKGTDLADLADLLDRDDCSDTDIARLTEEKFKLVRKGVKNRRDRVWENLSSIGTEYDATVPSYAPAAKTYRDAMAAVWPRIERLLPK